MQHRILIASAVGLLACEPLQPVVVVESRPMQAVAYVRIQSCGATDVRASCEDVHRACAGAGFYDGGYTEGKGIKVDCIEVLLRGAPVSGVSVRPESLGCIGAEWASARQRSESAADDFVNTCIYTRPQLLAPFRDPR